MKAVRQPALRAWNAAISAVISSAARCRGRPSVVNTSVTGPSVGDLAEEGADVVGG
jgi:hypothetical protein